MLIHRVVLKPGPRAKHGLAAVIETDYGSLLPSDDAPDAMAERVSTIPC